MWKSRTKTDLIIEVWEKLDCENVGAVEIEAIEEAVRGRFGESAVDSPMRIARLLADEGAELRHSEIMGLYIARVTDRPYEAALRDVLDIGSLRRTLSSIRGLESLRRRYARENDREGLCLVRETALRGKQMALETAERPQIDDVTRHINSEIAQWLTIWLQTPEMFENWVELRQNSREFTERFGRVGKEENK
jgi:hypothetical protein